MEDTAQTRKPWVETPLKESYALSRATGCRVFLKLENLQPSGSFKDRGIGNYLLTHLSRPSEESPAHPTHFYSSSGGNAGLACTHAARALSRPCTIVVPQSTPALMTAKMRAAGASDVVQVGATWADADAHLRAEVLAKDPGGVYVPPFDHPAIWDGHASVVREIAAQMPAGERPDAVLCSVGGGGLLCGVVQGIMALGWRDVPVLAVETKGADSLATSLRKGENVRLSGITSKATTLGAARVADRTFELASGRDGDKATCVGVKSVVLTDEQAARACVKLSDDERMMVELSCGVTLAVCYEGLLESVLGPGKLTKDSKVVVIACGGSNTTAEMLADWRKQYCS
ncbi:tryptophan synthase beta subunit-like PLP-dependent enzyme [Lineolata rhizophorae]|uniref:L-serine ammonia-lyase n=1 Tax=Lineolata rhizophorae TaxID=578093 RepID=A0A6A6NU91_9PEZI|nr:tryptophan synthase beta subunit-like PLP-dependent enzyme [Lineolata rhizophorae]